MSQSAPTNWSIFRLLCRVIGGQGSRALTEGIEAELFSQLVDMAQQNDVLPALAVKCEEQQVDSSLLDSMRDELLKHALRDNTLRNMRISAQVIKFTKRLNAAGITPLFLKGTALLLTENERSLGFRKQVDIDLLVEPSQFEAAAEVFLADGYGFLESAGSSTSTPTLLTDTKAAIKRSAAHHHLTPLAKAGYNASVELHKHFLPKRFQRNNPLEPLFDTAIKQHSHNANFLTPSAEYQVIHLLLGKLIHDGHMASRTFPIREACDYINVLEKNTGSIDQELIERHCANSYTIYSLLIAELMEYAPTNSTNTSPDISRRLQMMQKRYNSLGTAKLLDAYARTLHLGNSLLHSPEKLPAYLNW